MSENSFIPTTEQVRSRYVAHSQFTSSALAGPDEYGEAFDRWLASTTPAPVSGDAYSVNVALGFALRTLGPESGQKFMAEWNRHIEAFSASGDDRAAIRGAVGNVLVNSSNFPSSTQHHMLGQDMGPLIEKTTDAVLTVLASQPPAVQVDAATLADLHARWHDNPGNLVYEKCLWISCDFWEIANMVATALRSPVGDDDYNTDEQEQYDRDHMYDYDEDVPVGDGQ